MVGARGATRCLPPSFFGISVVVVHFSAMNWTDFVEVSRTAFDAPALANAQIALIVLLRRIRDLRRLPAHGGEHAREPGGR